MCVPTRSLLTQRREEEYSKERARREKAREKEHARQAENMRRAAEEGRPCYETWEPHQLKVGSLSLLCAVRVSWG